MTRSPAFRAGLLRLVERLNPGARVLRVERLRGGVSARTHSVSLVTATGERARFVLRRYVPGHYNSDGAAAKREHLTLAMLAAAGLPAARPLFVDPGGEHFGVPALVMSRLAGGPPGGRPPSRFGLRQLAEALAAIHGVTPETHDLSHLPPGGVERRAGERVTAGLDQELRDDPLAVAAFDALAGALPRMAWLRPVLIHGDFWPGNTVWSRDRLSGVVDWPGAAVGDPRTDVSQCRLDLSLMYGAPAADAFLREYEAATGSRLGHLWVVDLHQALSCLRWLRHWVAGYRDLGLAGATEVALRGRLESFVRRALAEVGR